MSDVNITSVWAALTGDLESGSGDLISIFHEMSRAWTRGKDVVLWNQLIQRFLLLHSPRFLKMITLVSTPSSSPPAITLIPTALLPMPFFYWVSFKTRVVEGSLLGLSALLETGDLCAWSLCALETTGAITCSTWSVQCSTTWHRLYCAVHRTVLSTPHQTIIGTSSPHGLDDK